MEFQYFNPILGYVSLLEFKKEHMANLGEVKQKYFQGLYLWRVITITVLIVLGFKSSQKHIWAMTWYFQQSGMCD